MEALLISYKPFWDRLKELKLSQYSLNRDYNISSGTLSRLKANACISIETIEKLCHILNCDIDEIVNIK